MYLSIQYTIWLFDVQACQKNINIQLGITETMKIVRRNTSLRTYASSINSDSTFSEEILHRKMIFLHFLHQYEYRKILLMYALICIYCIMNTDNFYIFIYYALSTPAASENYT